VGNSLNIILSYLVLLKVCSGRRGSLGGRPRLAGGPEAIRDFGVPPSMVLKRGGRRETASKGSVSSAVLLVPRGGLVPSYRNAGGGGRKGPSMRMSLIPSGAARIHSSQVSGLMAS